MVHLHFINLKIKADTHQTLKLCPLCISNEAIKRLIARHWPMLKLDMHASISDPGNLNKLVAFPHLHFIYADADAELKTFRNVHGTANKEPN